MFSSRFKSIFCFIFFLIYGCSDKITSSDIYRQPKRGDIIQKQYRTYTYFLVPDPEVAQFFKERNKDYKRVINSLKNFGSSIGEGNICVLVTLNDGSPDFLRSQDIIDKFNENKYFLLQNDVKYRKSPVIIVSNYNPEVEDDKINKYHTAIQFNIKDPDIICNYVTEIGRLIRNDAIHPLSLESQEGLLELSQLLKKANYSVGLKDGTLSVYPK